MERNKIIKLVILGLSLAVLLASVYGVASAAAKKPRAIATPVEEVYPKYPITAKFFTQDDCKYCDQEKVFLEALKPAYPRLVINEFSVSNNTTNWAIFENLSKVMGFSTSTVPVIVVDKDYYVGFDTSFGDDRNIRLIIDQAEARRPWEPAPVPKEAKVTLLLFWAEGCSHCAAEKEFLSKIAPKYPDLKIELFEVSENETSNAFLRAKAKEFGFSIPGVPITVIDEWYLIGYDTDSIQGKQIEDVIKNKISGDSEINDDYKYEIDLPFFGIIDTRDLGVPLSTVVIGFLDGFNPCAFFVLTMLLSFLMYAKSRRRMLLVGGIFVAVSGFVYFLAMIGMYLALKSVNIGFSLEGAGPLAIVGGLIALIIGIFNVKDFFFFKKGFSFSLPEDKKPKLYKRMRGLLKSQTMIELIAAAVILAFVANSYELICTATLPFVYDTLLLAQSMGDAEAFTYIALYCTIYILPLLAIVLVFVKKFEAGKMSEETGQLLKAISGFMMLGFGLLLLTTPSVLNNLAVIIAIVSFAIALSISLDLAKSLRKKEHHKTGGEKPSGEEKAKNKKPKRLKSRSSNAKTSDKPEKQENEPAKEPEV